VALFILVLLLAQVLVLSRMEQYASITPFCALAFPYAAVVLFAYWAGPMLGFVPFAPGSLVVWMCGLLVFWSAGFVLLRVVIGSELLGYVSRGFTAYFRGEDASTTLTTTLAILVVPLFAIGLLKSVAAAGGWAALWSPEFKSAYAHGFYGHIRLLCEPLEVLLIGTASRKRKLQITLACILAVFFLVGQVKGLVLQPLIAGFFYRFMRGRASLSLKSVGVVILCGILIFGAVYLGGMSIRDASFPTSSDTYLFIARHFSNYLMAGVLGFSEVFRTGTNQVGGSPAAIFTPALNVYNLVSGGINMKPWGSTSDPGIQIDLLTDDPNANTNVYSFFGTLYIYLGAVGASIYAIIAGLLCYTLWSLAGWSRNEWFLTLYCLIAAELFFGYFELYFWLLDPYEVALYVGILALCSSLIRRPLAVNRTI